MTIFEPKFKIEKSIKPMEHLGHSFGHISIRKQPIWEGDMPFESPKCPLKSGFSNLFEI